MLENVVYKEAKILIIDDQIENIELLKRILKHAGYIHLSTTTKPKESIAIFHEFQPDIILLDLHMPELDGRKLLQQLNPFLAVGTFLPVLVLTADVSPQSKRETLLLGAHDFLTKPFDRVEVLLRIRNHLRTRFLHQEVIQHSESLEQKVKERTYELEQAYYSIAQCLAKASEYRDDITGEHTKRVGDLSAKLAIALGFSVSEAEMIALAASLHDIGKIGIQDAILLKPGKLTDEEYQIMKGHTKIGKDIIPESQSKVLNLARTIAYTHHERWDGQGYPEGLMGEDIPIIGQIVALVDMYDALTHERPYKPAWAPDKALAEIKWQSGKQLNPKIVNAFLRIIQTVKVM